MHETFTDFVSEKKIEICVTMCCYVKKLNACTQFCKCRDNKGFFLCSKKKMMKTDREREPFPKQGTTRNVKSGPKTLLTSSETSRGLNSNVTSDQNYCTIQWLGTGCYSADFCGGDVCYCNDSDSGFSALHVYMLSNVLLDCMNEHCLFVWFSPSLEKLL